jgi:hypothetical protein
MIRQELGGRRHHRWIIGPDVHDDIEVAPTQRREILIARVGASKSAEVFEVREHLGIRHPAIEERHRVTGSDHGLDECGTEEPRAAEDKDALRRDTQE